MAGPLSHIDVERLVVWSLAALVVVAFVAGMTVLVDGGLAAERPQAEFECTYDADAGLVTVQHRAGDAFTDRGTRRLYLHARDADAGHRANLSWAHNGTGFRVEAGDRYRIDDPAVDSDGDGNYFDGDGTVGWHLAPEDTVEVRWVGDDGDRATLKRCPLGDTAG